MEGSEDDAGESMDPFSYYDTWSRVPDSCPPIDEIDPPPSVLVPQTSDPVGSKTSDPVGSDPLPLSSDLGPPPLISPPSRSELPSPSPNPDYFNMVVEDTYERGDGYTSVEGEEVNDYLWPTPLPPEFQESYEEFCRLYVPKKRRRRRSEETNLEDGEELNSYLWPTPLPPEFQESYEEFCRLHVPKKRRRRSSLRFRNRP